MTCGIKTRLLSFILTLLIIFQILPVTVFAEEMSGTTDEATVQDTDVSEYDTADMYYHLGTRYDYNKDGELLNIYNTIDYSSSSGIENDTITTFYNRNGTGRLDSLSISFDAMFLISVGYEYDDFDRITSANYNAYRGEYESTVTYEYYSDEESGVTSALVSNYISTVNGASTPYSYKYDEKGNITDIVGRLSTFRYYYDDIGQLIREDNPDFSRTYVYTYDKAGNITSKVTYVYTTLATIPTEPLSTCTYTYGGTGWGDQMVTYNDGTATQITYDAIGNPINYYNGFTFSWTGRQLTGATKGSSAYTFEYNADGLRTSKTVKGVKHNYYYSGTRLIAESWGEHLLVFTYDASGAPLGMRYRSSSYQANTWDSYWYEKNLHGDIVAIYDNNGTKLLSYKYDAWGMTATTYQNGGNNILAVYENPLRYRGYYYDRDLGMYYLGSRYYDYKVGRFISPDTPDVLTVTPMSLTDKNLYAYCDNNPVMRVDYDGEFWHVIGGALIGISSQFVSDLITSSIEGELSFSNWSSYVGAAIGGAVSALVPGGVVLSDVIGAAVTTIASSATYNLASAIAGENSYYSSEEIFYNVVNNSIASAVGAFGFNNSRITSLIPSSKIPRLEIGLNDFLRGAGISVLDGMKNSVSYSLFNTHIWNSPSIERMYPLR